MVVFDETKNNDGKAKGVLVISNHDIAYLMSKYRRALLEMLEPDYFEIFSKVEDMVMMDLSKTTGYDCQELPIETSKDELLLQLLKCEVQEGNIFTKRHLSGYTREEVETCIKDRQEMKTLEEQQQCASYQVALYALSVIESARFYEQRLYQIDQFGESRPQEKAATLKDLDRLTKVGKSMGMSTEFIESDYFEREEKSAGVAYQKKIEIE